jgi:hypothetical protein
MSLKVVGVTVSLFLFFVLVILFVVHDFEAAVASASGGQFADWNETACSVVSVVGMRWNRNVQDVSNSERRRQDFARFPDNNNDDDDDSDDDPMFVPIAAVDLGDNSGVTFAGFFFNWTDPLPIVFRSPRDAVLSVPISLRENGARTVCGIRPRARNSLPSFQSVEFAFQVDDLLVAFDADTALDRADDALPLFIAAVAFAVLTGIALLWVVWLFLCRDHWRYARRIKSYAQTESEIERAREELARCMAPIEAKEKDAKASNTDKYKSNDLDTSQPEESIEKEKKKSQKTTKRQSDDEAKETEVKKTKDKKNKKKSNKTNKA